MWTSDKVRKTFLDYFANKGHTIVASSSLVPINDPTLLFTNAGMNQFKDVFLGIDKHNYSRATTSQKCVRAGGKHNDLDTVGRTPRHHTFFEMLGNFSFGDYFKEDAIKYAWEFLTEIVNIPEEQLWITVYKDDDEAFKLWEESVGISPDRILRLGDEDNFWSMGDTGPCGPCSEIMYDRGIEHRCGDECGLGKCDCNRWLEIWNLVFMQYNRDEDGTVTPLPRPSIDTGMGLERITSVLQNHASNYDTDLFVPIIKQIEDITNLKYESGEKGFPFRVIADHCRACTFLIADGVLPNNEGRGYVLRRILRRAIRFGRLLGTNEAFLYKIVATVVDLMQDAYPELIDKKPFIEDVIRMEEERFMVTLNDGIKKVDEIIKNGKQVGRNAISGEEAFMLYDTYGFPIDLTEDMAIENGFTVDKTGFDQMMEKQRIMARQANKGDSAFTEDLLVSELLSSIPKTEFVGYDLLNHDGNVLAIIYDDNLVDEATNKEVILITDNTPFYAESGGQVADLGLITGPSGAMTVKDVKNVAGWNLHIGKIKGAIRKGEKVTLKTDVAHRTETAKNHTATHLLHKALREVLGEHAQQKGSLVEDKRLRFDFTHLSALTSDELKKIETIVNRAISQMYEVESTVTDIDTAKDMGAIALFGEKYSDEVRVVQINDFSMELCGGTHVKNTGEIGVFKIMSEGSIGSGLRRIEAVTGQNAIDYMNMLEEELNYAADLLKSSTQDVGKRIAALQKSLRDKERELEKIKMEMTKSSSKNLIERTVDFKGAKILIETVESNDANSLRQNAEHLKDKLGTSVVLLGSVIGDKVAFVCFVSKDLVEKGLHAGKIVGAAAKVAGGGGGGRPDMAQAGGRDIDKLGEALAKAKDMVENTFS
ncbi:MAG TPA: alanine--tRNA ligase [Syntrophomonadaceae bacterium]|nr:alanine--tRNA ligase [Syntrophomonadaceae bacterium]